MSLKLKKVAMLAVILSPMVGANLAQSAELVERMDVENQAVTQNQREYEESEMEAALLLIGLEGTYNFEQQNQLAVKYAQVSNRLQQISQGGKTCYLADRVSNMFQQYQTEETLEGKWRLLNQAHQALYWIERS
jgi:hypothetical protein